MQERSGGASVVIVNYNRAELLCAAVASVLNQTLPPAEIIVVDNGSSDGSAELVERKFPGRLQVIRLPENRGFAGGNNVGIRRARGEFVALMNNDAEADPNWLREMLKATADPCCGLVACRILRADHRDLLENLGVAFWPDGMSRGQYHLERDPGTATHPLLPSGCAMLLRRQAFEQAGGFDETFFCYSEDTDLFLKIRLAGWRCALAEKAVVYHRPGGTLGLLSPQKLYLVERNRLSVLLRFFPLSYLIFSPPYTLFRYLALGLPALRLRQRKKQTGGAMRMPVENQAPPRIADLLSSLLRAYLHAFRRLPADLKLRAEWKKKAAVPPGTMRTWLIRYRLRWHSLISLEPP